MSIFKAGWILIISFAVLIFMALLFAAIVPMNFYATAEGKLEPAGILRVSFPEDGRIDFLNAGENFEKGDMLARQDSKAEENLLASLKKQKELLESQLNAQKKRFEMEKKLRQAELEKSILSLERIKQEIPMQQGQLDMFTTISESLHTQKKLDEELKKQEADIFESLYKKQLIAKVDFLKVLHDKKIAEIMSEQAKAQTAEKLFDYKIELGKLVCEEKMRELEKACLEEALPPDAEQSRLEIALKNIEDQIMSVSEKIKNRAFYAPYQGAVLRYFANTGEFAGRGEPVMEIGGDNSKMLFIAVIDQSSRSDIKTGQKAVIYLDNFPFLKFGYLEGTLKDIQTDLSAPSTKYYLKILLDDKSGSFQPGLSGQVKIIIYHGTILNYLLRDIRNEDKKS